jgi:hypothetical protein
VAAEKYEDHLFAWLASWVLSDTEVVSSAQRIGKPRAPTVGHGYQIAGSILRAR